MAWDPLLLKGIIVSEIWVMKIQRNNICLPRYQLWHYFVPIFEFGFKQIEVLWGEKGLYPWSHDQLFLIWVGRLVMHGLQSIGFLWAPWLYPQQQVEVKLNKRVGLCEFRTTSYVFWKRWKQKTWQENMSPYNQVLICMGVEGLSGETKDPEWFSSSCYHPLFFIQLLFHLVLNSVCFL